MEVQSAVALSTQLVRLRRRMARRWRVCHALDDPELLAISQELDTVLYRFLTAETAGDSRQP